MADGRWQKSLDPSVSDICRLPSVPFALRSSRRRGDAPPMPLDAIAWPRVLDEIGSRRGSAGSSAVLDDAEGLSALFTRDYAAGAARLARVRDADPLNPLHTLRLAL